MKDQNGRILDWVVEMVRTKYADDIAILAVYGSYVNGTAHPLTDLDFFFIPKNSRGYEAARTFIVGGIGYDLFPMSWKRVEGLSMLEEAIVPLLGDSNVAYHATEEDLLRFMALRSKLKQNLLDMDFMRSRALDVLGKAERAFGKIATLDDLRNARLIGGSILLILCDALAYSNGTYFHKGLKGQYDDLRKMASLPEGFLAQYDACIEARNVAELKSAVHKMLGFYRSHLDPECECQEPAIQPEISVTGKARVNTAGITTADCPGTVDYPALVSFYEEALSTFNKIFHYCSPDIQNPRMAFLSAVSLQKVLDEEAQALNLDILTSYDYRNLQALADCVRSAESRLVSYISEGAVIKRYANFEEFSNEGAFMAL